MIHIDVNTTDTRREAIARRYWAITSSGEFKEEVDAIAADHGLTRGHVLAIARSISTVTSTVHCCVRCGTPKRFTCRKAFNDTPRQAAFVCGVCEDSRAFQTDAMEASGLDTEAKTVETGRTEGTVQTEGLETSPEEKQEGPKRDGHSETPGDARDRPPSLKTSLWRVHAFMTRLRSPMTQTICPPWQSCEKFAAKCATCALSSRGCSEPWTTCYRHIC